MTEAEEYLQSINDNKVPKEKMNHYRNTNLFGLMQSYHDSQLKKLLSDIEDSDHLDDAIMTIKQQILKQ